MQKICHRQMESNQQCMVHLFGPLMVVLVFGRLSFWSSQFLVVFVFWSSVFFGRLCFLVVFVFGRLRVASSSQSFQF